MSCFLVRFFSYLLYYLLWNGYITRGHEERERETHERSEGRGERENTGVFCEKDDVKVHSHLERMFCECKVY